MNKIGYILLLCLFIAINTNAQYKFGGTNAVGLDSNAKLIEFLSAETYNVKKMDSMDFLILVGHVNIKQGKTLLYGDSIILNTTLNTLEGFGNIHINDADSVHT